jgi:hypothetical protein
MIAKGNPHNDGPYLARYLAADSKGNEQAELAELRGFATKNVFDAFALGQLMAEGTRCEKPFFHVQVRLPKGEQLTREQWQKVADRIERQLGFHDQPRAVVFHQKGGQEHMHLVFSRINTDIMQAIDPGLYKRKLKQICRKLEKEMGLQQVKNDRDPDEKTQPAARPEYEQSRRLKTELKAIRESIRDCWDRSDSGRSFVAALDEKGFVFSRGDRRDFVIVDQKGGYHALSKRIIGMTVKEARGRLADIDAASLPSVAEAKALQHERHPYDEEGKAMPDDRAIGKEEELKEAIRSEEEKRQKAIAEGEEQKLEAIGKEEEGKQKAIADQEQQKQEAIKEAAQKEEERRRSQFKEQVDRQVEQAKEMELQEKQLDAYKAELGRMAEQVRREEEVRSRAIAEGRAKELSIRDPNSRYGQALAQNYNMKDPYGSLARSAMAEYGAFLRDRENLDRQIAQAKDPEARKALELRKQIEGAEYMAITSRRIASQSAVVHGKLNPVTRKLESEESIKQTARAEAFEKEAQELRAQFRDLHAERARETDKPAAARGVPQKVAEPKPQQKEAEVKRDSSSALMVEERPLGKPREEAKKLSDFMKNVPMPPRQEQPKGPPDRTKGDPAARRAQYEPLVAEQQRGKALDRMRADMKAGRNLSADDVRKLSRDDLEKIKTKGDDHLKQIVQERERQRAQERER